MWVAPARISGKTLRDANQFMFCGLRYRILRRMGRDALACPRNKRENPTPSTNDEAQLNCVALRPPLDYEVAWRAVKTSEYVCQVFFSGFLITTLSLPHKRSTRISTSNPGRNKRAQRRASRDQGCQIFIFVINNPVCQQRNMMRIHLNANARTAA